MGGCLELGHLKGVDDFYNLTAKHGEILKIDDLKKKCCQEEAFPDFRLDIRDIFAAQKG